MSVGRVQSQQGSKGSLQSAVRDQDWAALGSLVQNRTSIDALDENGQSSLSIACSLGLTQAVNILLSAGADCHMRDSNSLSIFHVAASEGKIEVLRLLRTVLSERDWKLLINSADADGYTPIARGCFFGHTDIAIFLFSNGGDLLIPNKLEETVLHHVCQEGHLDTLRWIMSLSPTIKSALLDQQAESVTTPIETACFQGHVAIVEFLVEVGAKAFRSLVFAAATSGSVELFKLVIRQPGVGLSAAFETDETESTCLHHAGRNGHSEFVKYFLSLGPKAVALLDHQNKKYNTAVYYACEYGHEEAARVLVEAGADVAIPSFSSSEGWTPLHVAAKQGHLSIVKLLLPLPAYRRTAGYYATTAGCLSFCQTDPLHLACLNGHLDVMNCLLEANILDSDTTRTEEGWNLLCSAVYGGNVALVQHLLAFLGTRVRQAVNHRARRGVTALNLAASSGHLEMLNCLLEAGADPIATTRDGWTVLHSAARGGNVAVVERVLSLSGGKQAVNRRTSASETPLHCACSKGHVAVAAFLVAHGADPEMVTQIGWNLLHQAAYRGKRELLEWVMTLPQFQGSSNKINALSSAGSTPMILAAKQGLWMVCKWLLRRGADPFVTAAGGFSVLHIAALSGKPEAVRWALDVAGLRDQAYVDAACKLNVTPLGVACYQGYFGCARLLLDAGANPMPQPPLRNCVSLALQRETEYPDDESIPARESVPAAAWSASLFDGFYEDVSSEIQRFIVPDCAGLIVGYLKPIESVDAPEPKPKQQLSFWAAFGVRFAQSETLGEQLESLLRSIC